MEYDFDDAESGIAEAESKIDDAESRIDDVESKIVNVELELTNKLEDYDVARLIRRAIDDHEVFNTHNP